MELIRYENKIFQVLNNINLLFALLYGYDRITTYNIDSFSFSIIIYQECLSVSNYQTMVYYILTNQCAEIIHHFNAHSLQPFWAGFYETFNACYVKKSHLKKATNISAPDYVLVMKGQEIGLAARVWFSQALKYLHGVTSLHRIKPARLFLPTWSQKQTLWFCEI